MSKKNEAKTSERHFKFSTFLPMQFFLFCKLMEVEPHKVIYDFLCSAGMENYGSGEQQRAKAKEYLLSCGYGQHFYTEEDIRSILNEMEAISNLFPDKAKSEFISFHGNWRDRYYKYWFRKWFRKVRRKK